jgi:hypothetical protein
MRIELRVDRNGQTISRTECDTERGGSFAESSKLALRVDVQRPQRLARPNGPTVTCGFRDATLRVAIPNIAISHAKISTIGAGAPSLITACAIAKTKALVLGPLWLLLVIREWLGLRDPVRVAGTLPLLGAVL